MFKLHRKVEFALIALKHMSRKRPGELTSAKEVSETYGCSFDTTARVMQQLAQKGILHSSQGATGGYLILKDLTKINMYDLSLILLGPMKLVKCLSSSHCLLESHCNIVTPMHVLNHHLMDFYKKLTISNLLESATIPGVKVNKTKNSVSNNTTSIKSVGHHSSATKGIQI